MKNIKIIILFFIILSCTTKVTKEVNKEKKVINVGCLSFIIPENMEESPEDAKKYRYKMLLVDKDKKYYSSSIMIAIREKKNTLNESLSKFAEIDQDHLQNSVSIKYDEEVWAPAGFKEKNINYISYQFKYTYGYEIIYQRSVYIECLGYFYIISLSSLFKKNISDEKNNFFWENINVIL